MQVNKVNCTPSFGLSIKEIPKTKEIAGNKLKLNDTELNGYTAFIGANIYTSSNKIEKQDLLFDNKKLIAIDDFDEKSILNPINYIIFNHNEIITPSIIDEHIHGGYGISFHNSNENEIRSLLTRFAKEGYGGVVATTLPGNPEQIKHQIEILSNIIKNPNRGETKLLGIHLEGPFLNPEKKGIHSEKILLEPSIESFLKLLPKNIEHPEDFIKIVTLAPELDKKYELTKYLQERGIIVSAGHSIAKSKVLLDTGIKQVTHIFNAMAPIHHRETTIANEGLCNPNVTAEMNVDGFSLSPDTMNLVLKVKPADKLIFVSDALAQAGEKNTTFNMNNKQIIVKNWRATDTNGTLAGGMQFLYDLVPKLLNTTTTTFKKFIRYSSINPAKSLGVKNSFTLKEGLKPNFTVWNSKTLKPKKLFIT